jgi:AcrR family transcriptional regulator
VSPEGRVYGGRSPAERREARRSALIDAGFEIFGTEGFGGATIERLCSRARVTFRDFYKEFQDREGLLKATYDRCVGEAMLAVTVALAGAGPEVRDRAERGIGAFVHTMLDDPRRARIVCLQVVGLSEDLERHRRSVLHAFADLVAAEARRLAEAGKAPVRPDYRLPSLALVGGANELLVEWLHSPEPRLPLDDLTRVIADLFLAAASGPD